MAIGPDHPALRDVATPALVLDLATAEANIERMAAAVHDAGLVLRPHAKTHKSVDLARRQLAAGAIGICCATVAEAEALAAGGITGLLVTSPLTGNDKAARIAHLNRSSVPIAVVVDHPIQVEALAACMAPGDRALGVLVDVDVGQARTGVAGAQDGLVLARMIARARGLAFRGLQGYAGHVQHIVDWEARQSGAARSAAELIAVRHAVEADGIACPILTGSGTGAAEIDMRSGPYTELQAGSYVVMDAEYRTIVRAGGERLPFAQALFVLATVVSANRDGQFTVDAGTKALAVNGPVPDMLIGAPAGSSYRFSGDEHGTITIPAGATRPAVGSRILIAASHCDPTVNLHAAYVAVGADSSVSRLPIIGKYAP